MGKPNPKLQLHVGALSVGCDLMGGGEPMSLSFDTALGVTGCDAQIDVRVPIDDRPSLSEVVPLNNTKNGNVAGLFSEIVPSLIDDFHTQVDESVGAKILNRLSAGPFYPVWNSNHRVGLVSMDSKREVRPGREIVAAISRAQ